MGYIVKIEKCNDENIAEKKEIFKTSSILAKEKKTKQIFYMKQNLPKVDVIYIFHGW